jgi:type I restriction enzyme S subunit
MLTKSIKPSDLGIIPNDWKRVKFGEITKVRQGLQIAISDRLTKSTSTSLEYITIQSINKANQDREYVESPSDRVICRKNDVLMTRTGNTGIVVTGVEGAFHNNFFLIDYKRNEIVTEFLVNYLRSKRVQHVLLTKAGTSTIPDLNHRDFYSIEFPLAPFREQQKIAQILSSWDKAIEKLEALIAAKQKRKKALMQQLLTGKKRFSGFEEEWKMWVLKNLGDTFNGLTGKNKDDFGFGMPYIPYINIFKNSCIDVKQFDLVDVGEFESQVKVKYGDIFFTTSSETPEEVGMSSILLDQVEEVYLNSFCFGFRLHHFKTLLPEYARYLFRVEHIRKQIAVLAQGATRYNLSKTQLLKISIELPCIEEQQKIASVLSAADTEIETHQKKLAALKEQKKGLMQQLLTGKKRVKLDRPCLNASTN